MDTTFIYALIEPDTRTIRYIGKANNPKKALSRHMCDGRTKTTHKANWIKSLVARGLKPALEIIDEVPKSKLDWPSYECAYIEFFLGQGYDLTNATPGGEEPPSCLGITRSAETRKKMSEGKKGEKNPFFWLGKVGPNAGRKFSDETRAKVSAALTGIKHSPERIEKSVAARRGKPRHHDYAEGRSKPAWSSSRFRGVGKHYVASKWSARINVNGRRIRLGLFLDEIEAAKAFDAAAIKYLGAQARLNFPD